MYKNVHKNSILLLVFELGKGGEGYRDEKADRNNKGDGNETEFF
ncbi:hypothetical protein [Petrotoga sp. 9PW.55.5.1]|nr:hypothetical protein [Petrotoga sp. 9PW.55.5.1]